MVFLYNLFSILRPDDPKQSKRQSVKKKGDYPRENVSASSISSVHIFNSSREYYMARNGNATGCHRDVTMHVAEPLAQMSFGGFSQPTIVRGNSGTEPADHQRWQASSVEMK